MRVFIYVLSVFLCFGCASSSGPAASSFAREKRLVRQLFREAIVEAEKGDFRAALKRADRVKKIRMGSYTRHIAEAQNLSIRLHCLRRLKGRPESEIPDNCRLHDGNLSASRLQLMDMLDEMETQEQMESDGADQH